MPVNGFRFGSLAYLSDIRDFSPEIFNQLQGVRCLVLSALRYSHSALHFSVDEAIDFANKVGAEKVWLTHISHELEHHDANAYLPDHMRLAYDGLEIDFE
jgi:phosphoribosyl 1,2-cyclic phosphate phosphodiesterase